jgi:HEAT repeat protein
LLGPAASLAQAGDARAEAFVLRAVTEDTDRHIRARAAEVSGGLLRAAPTLAKALGDNDPRVREAALTSVAQLTDPRAGKVQAQAWPADLFPAVAELLEADPFTFVRVHAAESLRGAPAGESGDTPLARALSDASPIVRGRAVDTLGARGAKGHAAELRTLLEDTHEMLDVRVRAARALGHLCDAGSIDRLTELVQKAAVPAADGPSQVLGASAAAALVRLNPPDLTKRMAPFTDPRAPRAAQEVGKAALAATERCLKSPQ